jgi:hypothetical protein
MRCEWIIDASTSMSQFIQRRSSVAIELTFDAIATELVYDYIQVFDGRSASNGVPLGQFSGSALPAPVTARSGAMTVQWISDGSVTHEGFTAHYTMGATETDLGGPFTAIVPAPPLSAATASPATAFICDGSHTLTASSSTLSDGWEEYPNNVKCMWLIQPWARTDLTRRSQNLRIVLTFETFMLENYYDWLSVYDGTTEDAPLLGKFTGSQLPPQQVALSSAMVVVLETDASIAYNGFSARYTTIYS